MIGNSALACKQSSDSAEESADFTGGSACLTMQISKLSV